MYGLYPFAIVGESFRNEDGSSRQDEISLCHIGETVELRRDRDNRHDHNCIRVISARGVQIGNIPRDKAEWLAPKMDAGLEVTAAVLSGGQAANGLYGANILVSLVPGIAPDVMKFLDNDDSITDDEFDE